MTSGDRLRIGVVRLGNIFFGISLVCTILTLFTAFTPFLFALYLLVLIFIVLITIGTIFVMVDDFGGFFTNSTEFMGSFTETALVAMPYFAGIGVAAAVLAVLLLSLEVRPKKHVAKIVLSVVFAVLTVAIVIFSRLVVQ